MPGEGQVLVRVEAVAVDTVDTYVRSGRWPTELSFPAVGDRDLIGAVVAAGPGVVGVRPGDRMWTTASSTGGTVLREAVRTLNPGYFALVMATGIVSVAAHHLGLHRASAVLLVVATVCWVLLGIGYCWRALAYRTEFLTDLRSPATGFAFFTVVAGCEVSPAGSPSTATGRRPSRSSRSAP